MVVISLDDGPLDGPLPQELTHTWAQFMQETKVRSRESSPAPSPAPPQQTAEAEEGLAGGLRPPPAEDSTTAEEAASKKAAPKKESAAKKKAKSREPSEKRSGLKSEKKNNEQYRKSMGDLDSAFACGSVTASLAAMERLIIEASERGARAPKLEFGGAPAGLGSTSAGKKCEGSASGCPFSSGKGAKGFFATFQQNNQGAAPTAVSFPEQMERTTVSADWKQLQVRSKVAAANSSSKGAGYLQTSPKAKAAASATKSSGMSGFFKNFKSGASKDSGAAVSEEMEDSTASSSGSVVMSFEELAKMNAGIIGADFSWFNLVLESFEELLAATLNANKGAFESACDVLSLQLYRQAKGPVRLKEFQTCMLASARAMLPQIWDSQHEKAWISCWECIANYMEPTLKLPAKYDQAVTRFVASMSEEAKKTVGTKAFSRLFREQPKAENFFKQSNAKLAFIVGKAIDMAVQIFHEPVRLVAEITQLGLRHIMFQASTRFFQPFITAVMEELQAVTKDELVIEGMNYALCVIGSIMVRTIETNATPALKAVVRDDVTTMKKALGASGRGDRSRAVLG